MGKLRFARKQGRTRYALFKSPKAYKESGTSLHGRKNSRTRDEIQHQLTPSVSGDSSDEHSTVGSEEEAEEEKEIVYKEPTMYDHLLKTLSSGESFATTCKKRQREENKSDTEEDLGSGLQSFSASEELDGSDGGIAESPKYFGMKSHTQGSDLIGEHNDNIGLEDKVFSKTDKAHDLEANGQPALKSCNSTSSFSEHLGYILSKAEIDHLSKRKLKYKWEVPASDMPNCKWMGTGECFIKDVDPNSCYGLKLRLYKHWMDIYKASGGNDFHLTKQRNFFSLFNSYRDIMHHNKKPFYLKGPEEDSNIMDAYLIHSLDHIFRTTDLVRKNDEKVTKHKESADELLNGNDFLDQGFTRPKVLIILPLASIAYRVVRRLIQLTPSAHKVNVEHLDRFTDEFGTEVVDNNGGNAGNINGDMNSQKPQKPSDFQTLFGGNNNDHFMIGIKFTRKSIKLYSDFYTSDMIVASPLGLVTT